MKIRKDWFHATAKEDFDFMIAMKALPDLLRMNPVYAKFFGCFRPTVEDRYKNFLSLLTKVEFRIGVAEEAITNLIKKGMLLFLNENPAATLQTTKILKNEHTNQISTSTKTTKASHDKTLRTKSTLWEWSEANPSYYLQNLMNSIDNEQPRQLLKFCWDRNIKDVHSIPDTFFRLETYSEDSLRKAKDRLNSFLEGSPHEIILKANTIRLIDNKFQFE